MSYKKTFFLISSIFSIFILIFGLIILIPKQKNYTYDSLTKLNNDDYLFNLNKDLDVSKNIEYKVFEEYTLVDIYDEQSNNWYKVNNKTLQYYSISNLSEYNFDQIIAIDNYWVHFKDESARDIYFNLKTNEIKTDGGNIGLYEDYQLKTEDETAILGSLYMTSRIYYKNTDPNDVEHNTNVSSSSNYLKNSLKEDSEFAELEQDGYKSIYENKKRSNRPNWDYTFIPIYVSDDHLIIKQNEMESLNKSSYVYWNVKNQSVQEIEDRNSHTIKDDDSRFDQMESINSVWFKDNKKNELYWFNQRYQTLVVKDSFHYTYEYGNYFNDYELLYLDSQDVSSDSESGYFILNTDTKDNYNSKSSINYSRVNLSNSTYVLDYVQSTTGDFFYLTDSYFSGDYDLWFIDSSQASSSGNVIEPIKVATIQENVDFLWTNNWYFTYELNGSIKTSTYSSLDNINYSGSSYFFDDGIYLNGNLAFDIVNPNISYLEMDGKVILPDENYRYHIEITIPEDKNVIIQNFNIKFKLKSDLDIKRSFPTFKIYKNIEPELNFYSDINDESLEEYVSNDNFFPLSQPEIPFYNTVYSDSIINSKIEESYQPLFKSIYINGEEVFNIENSESELWNYKFDPKVSNNYQVTILTNFNEYYYYQVILDNANKPINFFDTEDGSKVKEYAIKDGFPDSQIFYDDLNATELELLIKHLDNLFDISFLIQEPKLVNEYQNKLLNDLINWNDGHKIPLNEYDHNIVKNGISFEDQVIYSTVETFNNWIIDYGLDINSIDLYNPKELEFDFDYENKSKINQDSSVTIKGSPESPFIGELNFVFNLNYFNYIDLSYIDEDLSKEISQTLFNSYEEVLSKYDSDVNFGKIEDDFNEATINVLNNYDEIWSDSYKYRDVKTSDLSINYSYKEEAIKPNDRVEDLEYFRVDIEPKLSTSSMVINETSIKVENSIYKNRGVWYNFKGLFIFLILLIIILIFIFLIFVIFPWIKHYLKLKNIDEPKKEIQLFNEEEEELSLDYGEIQEYMEEYPSDDSDVENIYDFI